MKREEVIEAVKKGVRNGIAHNRSAFQTLGPCAICKRYTRGGATASGSFERARICAGCFYAPPAEVKK